MSTDDVILRLDGLTKHFAEEDTLLRRLRPDKKVKTVRAVDDVDLDLRRGETLGLVGESGCGKSTLARTALRLIEPTAGSIYFEGEDITEHATDELRQFRSRAQMVFQDPFASLNPRYTVRRTLTEPMAVHGIGATKKERNERAAELVERVGLGPEHLDRYPHEFSGGQRQRVAIARALAVEPDLIVADEPVSALDVSVQAQILNLLDELREEMGLSMLFISHDLSVIRRICDRVAVMYLGEIVETAPQRALFEDPKHPYAQALLSSIPVPDPTVERERIPLIGDVPTPIDPPSGCRFHPRCPKVIPPEDWRGDQTSWQRVLRFKKQVADGSIAPEAMRDQLEGQGEDASDEAVIEALYDEYVLETDIADTEEVSLPPDADEPVMESLDRLVGGDRDRSVALLDETFPTVCEEVDPRPVEPDTDRSVRCHLHDPDQPGEPFELGQGVIATSTEPSPGPDEGAVEGE